MNNACHTMSNSEILNDEQEDVPFYEVKLYGNKILTAKFSKRISCSIKHLPLRVKFSYEYDTIKALEIGIIKDPTLVLNGKIFLEGLSQTEEIVKSFEELLNSLRS